MKSYSLWLCATLMVFAGTHQAHAQIITNAEVERGLRYPGTPSYDGVSYTQRYSQGLGSAPIYFFGDSRQLYYLDYLDRADRAAKFGYRMPIDPYFETVQPPSPEVVPAPAERGVFGFGIWRRR